MLRALSFFLIATFSAFAQTEIPAGPEFRAIDDAPPPPPLTQQTHVATVTTLDASLLLWHETVGHAISQVYLGRVGPDGRVVNPTMRPIAPSNNNQKHPRAASDGKNILVIWLEEDNAYHRRLFGILTGPRGEPGHSAPFLIADVTVSDALDQQNPAAIAWSGENYLVAWSHQERWLDPREDPPLERIRYARVTTDGLVLDPDGLFVPESARKIDQTRPALAATGDGHAFLVWQDGKEVIGTCMITCPPPTPPLPLRIAGVVIAAGGVPASPEEVVLSEGLNLLRPAVAWNGHHFLIAWKNREDLRIEAARVNLDGRIVEGADRILIVGDRTYSPDPLALVADGDRFVVAWSDPLNAAAFASALLAAAVDREGNVTGPWTVSSGPDRLRPALLRTNAGRLLFYYDRTAPEPLLLRRIFGLGSTGYAVRRRPAR